MLREFLILVGTGGSSSEFCIFTRINKERRGLNVVTVDDVMLSSGQHPIGPNYESPRW